MAFLDGMDHATEFVAAFVQEGQEAGTGYSTQFGVGRGQQSRDEGELVTQQFKASVFGLGELVVHDVIPFSD